MLNMKEQAFFERELVTSCNGGQLVKGCASKPHSPDPQKVL